MALADERTEDAEETGEASKKPVPEASPEPAASDGRTPEEASPEEASPDDGVADPDGGVPVAQREFERGLEFHRNNRLAEAIGAYVRAVEIDPRHGRALNNLGVALRACGFHHAALAAYQRALTLSPDDPGLLGNRGNVLRAMGRYEEALLSLHAAIKRAPDAAGLHQNLGLVLRDLGHLEEAIGCFDRSLALRPDHPPTRRDRAHALLASGDYLQGFKALAACVAEEEAERFARVPPWHGDSLSGKTILVHAGGDLVNCVLFARLLPRLKAQGGRVLFECPRPLQGLMESLAGVDEMLEPGGEVWGVDQHVHLGALPAIFRITTNRIPAPVPYLSAPPEAGFELRHPESARLAVGIAWSEPQGPSVSPGGNMGLEPFFALLENPDLAVYSLQRGPAGQELKRLGAAGMVMDLSNLLTGLDDIARVIEQLDLVITADSLVAHIAGALGRTVWLALPAVTDWRWQLQRDASPWYPSMRLFRRDRSGDWDKVFAGITSELGRFSAQRPAQG